MVKATRINLPGTHELQALNSHETCFDFDFQFLVHSKSSIGETKLNGISKHRDEVVLHRARIGHTHLTHCFLLKAEEQPECDSCQCGLSVEHILSRCPALAFSREKYFEASRTLG